MSGLSHEAIVQFEIKTALSTHLLNMPFNNQLVFE